MKKSDLLVGLLIGIIAAGLGSYIFIVAFIDSDFFDGLMSIKENGQLGKIITLGAVLNLATFFLLLHFKKELMARGVILATILLALITILL